MTATHTIIIQVLLGLVQLGNQATNIVPDKWKPVVLGVVALASIIQAKIAHQFNPDGTSASVAFVAKMLLLMLLCSGAAMAQTSEPTPIFSVSQQAVAVKIGGQTVAGSDSIGSLTLMQNSKIGMIQLQSDNLLAPGINLQAYLGGVKAYSAFLANLFAKTSLNVAPYFHAAFGIVRNVPSSGPTKQHYSALADIGFDYKIKSTFSFGPRIGYFNAPGFGGGPHGAVVSANLTVVLSRSK